jgi:hypothetical protein
MFNKRIVPIRPNKQYYDHWLATFQCVNLWRKEQANYWYNLSKKLAKALADCQDKTGLEQSTKELIQTCLDNYFYYTNCPPARAIKEMHLKLDFKLYGLPSPDCPDCKGCGYTDSLFCICEKCRGWGKDIEWVLKKKDSLEGSITIIRKNGKAIQSYKEIGIGFWSLL